MTVDTLAQTDPITTSAPHSNLLQRYSAESAVPGFVPRHSLQPRRLESAAISLPANVLPPRSLESEASFRVEIDAARLLFAIAAAICATGPIIWVLVRYWLFAP